MPGFYHTKKEQTWIFPGAKHWLNTLYDPMLERNGKKRFSGLQQQHPRVKRMESCLNPVSVLDTSKCGGLELIGVVRVIHTIRSAAIIACDMALKIAKVYNPMVVSTHLKNIRQKFMLMYHNKKHQDPLKYYWLGNRDSLYGAISQQNPLFCASFLPEGILAFCGTQKYLNMNIISQ